MNKSFFVGRLAGDPKIYVTGDVRTARFSIAVGRRKKDEVDFFNMVCFGAQADFVEKYLKQGRKVAITCRPRSDTYTNKEGRKVYSVQFIVEEIDFADSRVQNQENQEKVVEQTTPDIPNEIEEELPFC